MKQNLPGYVRLAVAASSLLLLTTACGGASDDDAAVEDTPSEVESDSGSAEPTEPPEDSGGGAASECAGETQEVEAIQGVRLTVPADWTVESFSYDAGVDVRLATPDGDSVEGQLVVEESDQSIEEVVADAERLNSQSEKTAEEEVTLAGFEEARRLSFTGGDSTNTTVVAVAEGLRVIAYTIVEGGSPESEALAAGCVLTLQR